MAFPRVIYLLLPAALLMVVASAGAEMKMPSMKGMGMPDLSGMGAGNAAGVLGYCVKNKALGGGDAGSVMSSLTKKAGGTSAPGFAAGQAGKIDTGGGSSFSLDSVQGKMKGQACDMVLKQAKTLM